MCRVLELSLGERVRVAQARSDAEAGYLADWADDAEYQKLQQRQPSLEAEACAGAAGASLSVGGYDRPVKQAAGGEERMPYCLQW